MRRREKASREAVLIGFMGAGKSAVGKALADRLGAEFVDVDEHIEKTAGKSIREIFASLGEGAFREMEKEAIRGAVSVSGRVIAAGGGAFLDGGNRRELSAYGPVFFLDVSAETVRKRLSGDRLRPLLPGDGETLRAMMEARRPAYLLADFTVPTDGRSVAEIAERILDLQSGSSPGAPGRQSHMNPEMLTVALGDRAYDIFFGEDIFPMIREWVTRFYPGKPVFIVTDRNVESIYGEDIRLCLGGNPHRIHAIEPGEATKNWQTVLGVYAFLAEGDAGRDALVVAFGGGVVGDIAGFAAATWLRGVPCIQVPTTLLAQVDSSVGGKTGFNLPEGKNLVGAFHQPQAVFIGNSFLRTLDDRELLAGMGEVVKCAFAGDPGLWETLCSMGSRWKEMSGREWREIIRRSVAFKASIVSADERETSLRRVLNLGHTVGHAMEQAGGYGKLLHGEAVAMGLAWEAVLARRLGFAPPEAEDRLCALLAELGFALDDPAISIEAIASAVGMDKKRIVSDVDIPVVTAPGTCALKRVPLLMIRKELPAVREEIMLKGAAIDSAEEKAILALIDEGDLDKAIASLERRVESSPRDLRAMVLLSETYLTAGKHAAAWETIKEALQQHPTEPRVQRLAREIEGRLGDSTFIGGDGPSPPLEYMIFLDGEAFEIRPADLSGETTGPVAASAAETETEKPSVLTVTMADVCWEQGEKDLARRIVDEILRRDPADIRALEWKKGREERSAESALAFFLGTIAKEYGYELSRPH